MRRQARGARVTPVEERAVTVSRRGTEIEATYQVAYNSRRPIHRPVHRTLTLPASFYDARRHLLDASPRVTNHDLVALWLYTRLLDQITKKRVVIAEFGVWRGAFLENLAIHASATGKELVFWGFDSFDAGFPDIVEPIDLRSRPREDYAHAVAASVPSSTDEVSRRLARHAAVVDVHLVRGDITRTPPRPTAFDLVHFDMDFYAAFAPAMAWLENVHRTTIAVDDYYQPSWVGIVDAVNEFAEKHRLFPVNLSDYFRIERSLRTQWIALLLPLRDTP
jgi:hypothetical protein